MTTSELLQELDRLKSTMISVATGGPRIDAVQDEFAQRFDAVSVELASRGLGNPLPYRDLWQWYGHWSSDDDLKKYQARRTYVGNLFESLIKTIQNGPATQPTDASQTMARQPLPQQTPPKLSREQLKIAIDRIQRRISDVDALNPNTLGIWSPRVDALQASIDDALSRTFGHGTVQYERYRRAVDWSANIPLGGGETTLEQYREDVAKGKEEVSIMLGQAVQSLQEELAEYPEPNSTSTSPIRVMTGKNIVIGHGGSPLWRELKDFIKDRLFLPVEEFNSVSVAGVPTVARLTEMLDGAAFAFLVMTAEDQQPDGTLRARENVVHEIGLFQGRLGFKRAIVLLENGCKEFSNIQGLGQIRFPSGNISAKFEEIRIVLEREGVKAS